LNADHLLKTISIIVSGKVQGVYYRQGTKEKAIELGITGQVKNLRDGTVYIIATGTDDQLQLLQEWCKAGPVKAVVASVEIKELTVQEFTGFAIVRSPWL